VSSNPILLNERFRWGWTIGHVAAACGQVMNPLYCPQRSMATLMTAVRSLRLLALFHVSCPPATAPPLPTPPPTPPPKALSPNLYIWQEMIIEAIYKRDANILVKANDVGQVGVPSNLDPKTRTSISFPPQPFMDST
jgi:hypothetical protein